MEDWFIIVVGGKVVKIDIVGTMINNLIVLERNKDRTYKCRCNLCGKERVIKAGALRSGNATCFCKYLTQQA